MKTVHLFVLTCILIAAPIAFGVTSQPLAQQSTEDAPAGFDNAPNGLVDQATFDEDLAAFAAVETVEDGIGPVYNAASCGECHANPVIGGSSQVLEMRAGRFDGGLFTDHPGGSLIHSRAIHPDVQEQILEGNPVRTFRASTSILGLGYVEAIDDATLLAIASEQSRNSGGRIAGQAIMVPVLEAPGQSRIGRFGWKCQHASLLSFAGDAYLNEMGITTPMFPVENTSNGRDTGRFDDVADPDEADNDDLEIFARFMRATKTPERDRRLADSRDAREGERLFNDTGCSVCHVPAITTASPGTPINGGAFFVPDALGNKTIHPFSDFLLHDVGTGDGIVDNGYPETRNKIRTAPLWGLRTRNRLMHDGASLTVEEAVLRHAGEARSAARQYRKLTNGQRRSLLAFLNSL